MMQPVRKQSFESMKAVENVFRRGTGLDRLTNALATIDKSILAVHWTHESNDRLGIDAILEHLGGRLSKVDFKFRRATAYTEWVLLETFSNLTTGAFGWASKPSNSDLFAFVRFLPNGFICQVLFVKTKAINDLLNNRYDELLSSGIVRRSGSTGNRGNQWQGEFVAIEPSKLMKLLNMGDYAFHDFMAGGTAS
jgi:hypothetical protein